MRNWFEFGYNGFPTGEQRRRFYRQRDDPCDSEEDKDYDDESNDRPIHYYPLRDSEGEEDESGDEAGGVYGSGEDDWDDDSVDAAAGGRGGGGVSCSLSTPVIMHASLNESVPSWYGASVVTFSCSNGIATAQLSRRSNNASSSDQRRHYQYTLWHAGAPRATHVADNSFRMLALSHCWGERKPPQCTIVPENPSLRSCFRWGQQHPQLVLMEAPSPRFGHCAAALLEADPLYLLPPSVWRGRGTAQDDEGGDQTPADTQPSLLHPEWRGKVEVHTSIVIGGAAGCCTDTEGSASVEERHTLMHYLRLTGQRLVSPMLCVTLANICPSQQQRQLARSVEGDDSADTPHVKSHWTACFPLSSLAVGSSCDRVFATLTPWPRAQQGDATRKNSMAFAYLGGTKNGWEPVPLFALTHIHVCYTTWMLNVSEITTFGTEPPARYAHTATMEAHSGGVGDGNLYVFGGLGRSRQYLNDLYVLNTATRVWREVFIPLTLCMPPRAFHCAALVRVCVGRNTTTESLLVGAISGRRACTTSFSEHHNHRGEKESFDCEEEEELLRKQQQQQQQLCQPQERGRWRFLLAGGEADGVSEPSVWSCTLDGTGDGVWKRWEFPLLDSDGCYSVTATSSSVTASHLKRAVHSLVEREASISQSRRRSSSAARSCSPSSFFVAACHGSLAQLLPTGQHSNQGTAPANDEEVEREGDGAVIMLGGSRSPPVLLVSCMEPVQPSLMARTTLWLLENRSRALYDVLKRMPHVVRRLFGATQFSGIMTAPPEPDAPSGYSQWGEEELYPTQAVNTEQLVAEASLNHLLLTWLHVARKRLRNA